MLFRALFVLSFLGTHAAVQWGLYREWKRGKRKGGKVDGEAVSVIIPFRDEAEKLPRLLQSLSLQRYPRLEFILVDDRSRDGGELLVRSWAEEQNREAGEERVTLIQLRENPGPNAKQYALGRGIAEARSPLLLFTDADCIVPPRWVEAMAAAMGDQSLGALLGPVFKEGEGRGFFRSYQCFDHAVRYFYLAGSTGLGAAGGGFGNNIILRRSALEALGGYEQVPPSPTEDAALVSLMRSRSLKVAAGCSEDLWVFTAGEGSWRDLLNQTLRWNNGGLFSPERSTRYNFRFLMISISLGMLAIPLLPFFPGLWPLPAAVLTAMGFNTLSILGLFHRALPRPLGLLIPQVIFTPAYFTLLTILGFGGYKTTWKSDAPPSIPPSP